MIDLDDIYSLAAKAKKPTKQQATDRLVKLVELINANDHDSITVELADLLRFFTVPPTPKNIRSELEAGLLIINLQLVQNPKYSFCRVKNGVFEAANGCVAIRCATTLKNGMYNKNNHLDVEATKAWFDKWPDFSRVLDLGVWVDVDVSEREQKLIGTTETIKIGLYTYNLKAFLIASAYFDLKTCRTWQNQAGDLKFGQSGREAVVMSIRI